jgi:Zinc carboxypeptidase.
MRRALFALTVLLVASFGLAQQSAVPSPRQVLGYDIGERFTPSEQVAGYFRVLEAGSPRVKVTQYGESYEGRPMVFAVITSEKNHARLDAIRANSAAINRPDTTSADAAQKIAADQPVIVWLAFGVHGNESSSSEAAMLVGQQLLDGSSEMSSILDRCVIIIDPVQNPDGRDRFVNWYRSVCGASPDDGPDSREHREPWPGGRFNHYMSDMNRDWAWATQRETQARVAAYRTWNPQLFVDFHEMGRRSTYFFPPNAHPRNTNISEDIQKWLETFGRANADAFSMKEWPFFVHERYDLFYPGYGDSWPSLRGAIGMTYEVGGQDSGGLIVRNEDGLLLTLRDRADRHFTTAMTTIRTAAEHRPELILFNYESLASHYRSATNSYLVLPDSPNLAMSMKMLQQQGIVVQRLEDRLRLRVTPIESDAPETRDFPAGTAVISAHQPLGALAESLLERTPQLPPDFLTEQRKRVDADEEDEFYDVTAWAIPIADNLEAFMLRGEVAGALSEWHGTPGAAFQPARFAYLVSALDPAVYHVAGRLLDQHIRFSVSEESLGGASDLPRGSLAILRNKNPQKDFDDQLRAIATATGASFVPVDSAWTQGVSLGSSKVHWVRDPKIALLAGSPVNPTSFGTLWHILDIDVPIPHSVIAAEHLSSIDLDRYRVLVLPDGERYAASFSKAVVERLQGWVHDGGVLVAVQGAGDFLRDKDVEVSKVKTSPDRDADDDDDARDEEKGEPATPKQERYNDYRIPGAAFRTQMNDRSFLTFGVPRSPSVILEGTTALLPVEHKIDNVVTVLPNDPVASGFAWPESVDRFKASVYLVIEKYGEGRVITFAGEPDYRLFWRGTLPLFLNSVLYGPTFASVD